jgi:hypothetical protein
VKNKNDPDAGYPLFSGDGYCSRRVCDLRRGCGGERAMSGPWNKKQRAKFNATIKARPKKKIKRRYRKPQKVRRKK